MPLQADSKLKIVSIQFDEGGLVCSRAWRAASTPEQDGSKSRGAAGTGKRKLNTQRS